MVPTLSASTSPQQDTVATSTLSVTNLDRLVVAYLLLPNLIFLGGWLKPVWGIPAVLLLLAAAGRLLWRRTEDSHYFSKTKLFLCLILATGWLLLSGIGHYVYANDDWIARDAVLADLTTKPWPVGYTMADSGEHVLLRAPLGYYLPAALVSSMTGATTAADQVLCCWTLAGVMLVFYLIIRRAQNVVEMLVRLIIFMLFSGMDLIGRFLLHPAPDWGQHLEWWAGRFQYTSNTTALFWVPNHSLAAWLALVWLLDQQRHCVNWPLATLIAACTPLWSPLSAAGLLPLYATVFLCSSPHDPRGISERCRTLFTWPVIASTLTLVILVYPYLFLSGETVYSGWTFHNMPWLSALKLYSAFVLLEFGLLLALLFVPFRHDRLLWAAGLTLSLLPLYKLGPVSDFAMRASLPALALLSIRLGDWAIEYLPRGQSVASNSRSGRFRNMACAAAMLLFIVGLATPCQEFIRAIQETRWDFSLDKSMADFETAEVTHYVCPRQGRWAETFLRN